FHVPDLEQLLPLSRRDPRRVGRAERRVLLAWERHRRRSRRSPSRVARRRLRPRDRGRGRHGIAPGHLGRAAARGILRAGAGAGRGSRGACAGAGDVVSSTWTARVVHSDRRRPSRHDSCPGRVGVVAAANRSGRHRALGRAVITGAGAVSAFGVGLPALFDGLAEGRAAVRGIRSFDASMFPVRVAGEVPVAAIDAEWLARELAPVPGAEAIAEEAAVTGALRDRKVAFALLAAAEAWRTAGSPVTGPKSRLSLAAGLAQAVLEDLAPLRTGRSVDWSRAPDAPLPAVRFPSPADLGPRLADAP